MLGEHEATASRQLARTRREVRDAVEHDLQVEGRLGEAAIAQCFESVTEDAGPLDLRTLLGAESARKESPPDRSN
jgi:hypothetical protein